jgi:hypothetical protein
MSTSLRILTQQEICGAGGGENPLGQGGVYFRAVVMFSLMRREYHRFSGNQARHGGGVLKVGRYSADGAQKFGRIDPEPPGNNAQSRRKKRGLYSGDEIFMGKQVTEEMGSDAAGEGSATLSYPLTDRRANEGMYRTDHPPVSPHNWR